MYIEMIASYSRGHKLIYLNKWFYADTLESYNDNRACAKCGKHPVNGHDACLGYIKGVSSACCGHGITEEIN